MLTVNSWALAGKAKQPLQLEANAVFLPYLPSKRVGRRKDLEPNYVHGTDRARL